MVKPPPPIGFPTNETDGGRKDMTAQTELYSRDDKKGGTNYIPEDLIAVSGQENVLVVVGPEIIHGSAPKNRIILAIGWTCIL